MNEVKERVKEMNSAMDAAEFTSTETRREIPFAIEVSKEQVQHKSKRGYLAVKRCLDVVLSFIALILLSPVFLVIAILIKLEDKGPVIYKSTRIGKGQKPFTMYKFRSMCMDADQQKQMLMEMNERDGPAFKMTEDPRITKVGAFIRKTCIDELPQLVNVLKGDMSIVGPRPPLPEEVAKYSDYQLGRLSVTPGLTCYWQVNKGEDTTFEEWVEMDLKYIQNRSILVDIKLIFATIKVVLSGKGEG